jgi:FkbM family methyltransferase
MNKMKNLNLNVRRIILKVMRNCYLGQKIEELYRPFLVYKRLCADIKIHSQFGQDLLACLYFNKKKDGFFVDIGANSGLIGSNTYALEKLGWEGVCIEPQPDIFVQLKKNRKCACYNVALSSQAGDVNFFKVHGLANELSGLNDDMSEERKNEAKRLGRTEIIRVKTMTFDAIMQDFPNRKHIDFMSIDVEGHEVQILKSIDFVNYSFGLITIEKSEPKEIVAIMEQNGYKYLMDLGADIMFAPLQSKLPPPPPQP